MEDQTKKIHEESDGKFVIKCESCSDDVSPVSWCVQCTEFICGKCVMAHQRLKITKDHIIQNKCSCSDDVLATSWCVQCCEFICENCVLAHQRLKITKNHMIEEVIKSKFELEKGKSKESIDEEDVNHNNSETKDCENYSNDDHQLRGEVIVSKFGLDNSESKKSLDEQDVNHCKNYSNDDHQLREEEVKEKRTIDWIMSAETITIPKNIWEKVFPNNTFHIKQYTYYKSKICQIFDETFSTHCILILQTKNAGKSIISLTGKCKHKGCRKYKLICTRKDLAAAENPKFMIYYSKPEIDHKIPLTGQLRGVLRHEAKNSLKTILPATYVRQLVVEMDENLYKHKNANKLKSDCVLQKARSEMTLEKDYAKDDFDDMVQLQKATQNDPYIQQVISPFAVYIYSSIQFKVLVEYHKRKEKDEEVVGYLDATGGCAYVTPGTSTHPVLYYPLLINIKGDVTDRYGTLFAVTESLNSGHGVPNITGWLSNFNEKFMQFNSTIIPVFHRIIFDFSYANLHGILHTFESMRMQQYLYVCYRFAVGLTDFSELLKIVKIQLCRSHLSKSMASFVRQFYPSLILSQKSTTEQKYVTEILCALMSCKSYNIIKEIFRNLCIIILSQHKTPEVDVAKDNIIHLTTQDVLLTTSDELKTKYKYDIIVQADIDILSENESAYDYNKSILKLPIYKGSLFYQDLKHIYDDVKTTLVAEELELGTELENNDFLNTKILVEFMKQYGGILPIWTGLTIPKGIEGYSNQSAESQMNIVKRLLDEKAIEIGMSKIKPTRFIKLIRPIVVSHAKRYLLKIPRRGLNYGKIRKNKQKDNSKVAEPFPVSSSDSESESDKTSAPKAPITTESSSQAEAFPVSSFDSESESDKTSAPKATESWGKKPSRKRFSYFQKNTILSKASKVKGHKSTKATKSPLSTVTTSNSTKSAKSTTSTKSAPKSTSKLCSSKSTKATKSPLSTVNSTKSVSSQSDSTSKTTITKSKDILPNGLIIDVKYYLQDIDWDYVVAKINESTLPISDYKTLLPDSSLSVECMNYVVQFILPQTIINLTKYSKEIIQGLDCLPFSIVDKICFMPCYIENRWTIYIFNTKKCSYCFIDPCSNINSTLIEFKKFFSQFICSYNAGQHKNKLKPIEHWKDIEFKPSYKVKSADSGIYIVHCMYSFSVTKNLDDDDYNPDKLRKELMSEVLQYSDDVKDICLKCGEKNDTSMLEKISWTQCDKCLRWMHDLCQGLTDVTGDFSCPICKAEEHLKRELAV